MIEIGQIYRYFGEHYIIIDIKNSYYDSLSNTVEPQYTIKWLETSSVMTLTKKLIESDKRIA